MAAEPMFTIDPRAMPKLNEIRQSQPDGDDLALAIAISGVDGDDFVYEMAMMLPEHAAMDDVLVPGEVQVVIRAEDVENLRGATLTLKTRSFESRLPYRQPEFTEPRRTGRCRRHHPHW